MMSRNAAVSIPATLAPVYSSCPKKLDWAVTFDDGPSSNTPQVLSVLAKYGLKATFFVVGSRARTNPEILKQIYAAKHQIALHTWSHPSLSSLTDDQIKAELLWNMKAVQDAIGTTPKFFRPPFGDYNGRVRRIASGLGLTIIMWNTDSNDWRAVQNPAAKQWTIGNVTNWANDTSRRTGYISVHHDLYSETTSFIEEVINIIRSN